MLIVIANLFKTRDKYGIPTGQTELLADYAIEEETGKTVVVPPVHPAELGAMFDRDRQEWVILSNEMVKNEH